MAQWYLGELNRGDEVWVIDTSGQELPKKTKVRRILDNEYDPKWNLFHCRQIEMNGVEIWSFDYNGNTIDGRHEVVTARE